MWWNKEKKESKTQSILVAGGNLPSWGDNYQKLAKEGYIENDTINATIRLIATSCAGIPWLVYQAKKEVQRKISSFKHKDIIKELKFLRTAQERKDLIELETHPLISVLQKPHPRQGMSAFIQELVSYLFIAGECYVEKVNINGKPKELYNLRPDRIKIKHGDSMTPIQGYEYTVGGQSVTFPEEDILHIKMFHPLDDWHGLSLIRVSGTTVDLNNLIKKWNAQILLNDGKPSGIINIPGTLTQDKRESLREEWKTSHAGYENVGMPIFTEGGMTWQQIGLSPKDIDWIQGLKQTTKQTAINFHIPPELLGDAENKTYSNYKEARQAFYIETILPLMDFLRDEFNNWLTIPFGEDIFINYDIDEVEAIQEERNIVWQRAIEGVKNGIVSINEAREMLGYTAVKGGDDILIASNLIPYASVPSIKDYDEE